MPLTQPQLAELAALAIEAAKRAASMIQGEAGSRREVLRKEGGSSLASQVVTAVDLESQRLILDTLQASLSAHDLGLLTEESPDDASRHRCDHFWCIDPLDGTLPFIEGSPGYSVSIALVSRDGTPTIGVVVDPASGTMYHAVRGGGAFRDGVSLRAPSAAGDGALTVVMDRSFAKQPNHAPLMENIEQLAAEAGLRGIRVIDHGGAAMNACWVIEEAPAIYFKFPKIEAGGGSLWDYAATACLFGELGLPASDIHGAPLDLNRKESTFMNLNGISYASSESLARAVRDLHRRFGPPAPRAG